MKYGYQLARSAECIKVGSLETCTAGPSFDCSMCKIANEPHNVSLFAPLVQTIKVSTNLYSLGRINNISTSFRDTGHKFSVSPSSRVSPIKMSPFLYFCYF